METEKEVNIIYNHLYKFYLELNPQGTVEKDARIVLDKIRDEVAKMLDKIRMQEELRKVTISFHFFLLLNVIITVRRSRRDRREMVATTL